MNKQIAAAMAVVMAVFLTAACIGASAEDTDAAGPYEFTVDYDGYSISFYASKQASEGVNGTAYIKKVTINQGSTDVELDLPEIVTRSDTGYEGTYNVTGIGTQGNAMVVFSTEDGADKIKSISMPDTYTWLTSQAFVYCSNLESVKLSAGLESIPEKTFSKITQIGFSSTGEPYIDVIAPGPKITSIDIPEGIKTIGVGAFQDCPTLTHVSIPSTVTDIQQEAFRNTGLTTVEIKSADENTARSIGNSAFASNEGLTAISIPEGFTKISNNAFESCTSMTEVIIPGTMEQLYSGVFDKCTSLETVTFSGAQPPIMPSGTFGTDVKFIVPEGSETAYQTALDTATGGTASVNDYVAMIGDEEFLTLKGALDAAQSGDIVILLMNTQIEPVTISNGITLNLGGNTLNIVEPASGSSDRWGITLTAGDSTITNGKIIDERSKVASNKVAVYVNGETASLTTTDVEMTAYPSSGGYSYVLRAEAGASVTLGDGTSIVALENGDAAGTVVGVALFTVKDEVNAATTELMVEDGVRIYTTGYAIAGNGNNHNTSVTINGGDIKSQATALYHPQYGQLTINGGRIESTEGAGIVMCAGELAIEDADIVTHATSDVEPGDSGHPMAPSAVVVDASVSYPGLSYGGFFVEIRGGTYVSADGIDAVTFYENTSATEVEDTVSISGGTFSSDISEYCVPGFEPVRDANGNYVVGSDEPDQSVTVPDDDELPPFIPAQPDDDDSVTIVACAAAAVVAALMAVFLILTYRKD